MNHLTLPMDALREEASFFLRTTGLRCLHVAVDEPLRGNALTTLAAMEFSPDTSAAMVTIGHEWHGRRGSGWVSATDALRSEYLRIKDGLAEAAIELPDLPAPRASSPPLEVFALQLHAALAGLTRPPSAAQGLVCVFAPRQVEDEKELARDLGQLIRLGQLVRVRWMWLDAGGGRAGHTLCRELGDELAIHHECRIDQDLQRRELDELLDAMADAQDHGPSLARAGAVFPRRPPPPHPDDPPVDARREAGPPAPATDAVRPFLQALRALRKGDAAGAVALQREARDAALAGGVTPLAVDMDVLLATFMAQAAAAEDPRLVSVLSLLGKAADRAERAGLRLPAAKVCLVLAGYARLAQNTEVFARALRRAADHAAAARMPALQIEALRQLGESLIELEHDEVASKALREAIEAAETLPAAERGASGAEVCVGMLAGILRRKGQEACAGEIERRFAASEVEAPSGGAIEPTGTEGD